MKTLISSVAFCLLAVVTHAQTLVAGEIAFIGYNSDGTDDFTFIALTDIPAGEVIYFTEEGWNSNTGAWMGTTEGHYTWTAPGGGTACGTVVHIDETSGNVLTPSSGTMSGILSGSGWSLFGGDQVLAYYSASGAEPAAPTFLAGVHGDGNAACFDAGTGWNGTTCPGTGTSNLPVGLTNATDCVALFPGIAESDNAKYTGTLTGTATALRASINDRTNWSVNDATAFAIAPGDYSPSVTCATVAPEIDVLGNSTSIPDGDITPIPGDDTDFGSVALGSALAPVTFTIDNSAGAADLTLTGTGPNYVTISGDPGFTISTQPTGATVTTTVDLDFAVTFTSSCANHSAIGTYSAVVSIANDDADEDPYTFTVQATVTGTDTDSDGDYDFCDTDDDNDGILDGADPDDTDFNICGDSDADGCDDCSVTNDGFGALSDSDPANDGTDSDCDGICDATDVTDGADQDRGNMLSFTGATSGDHIDMGDVAVLNFTETDDWTAETWIFHTAAQEGFIVGKYDSAAHLGWAFVVIDEGGTSVPSFRLAGGTAGDQLWAVPTGLAPLILGEWNHIAVTYDGSNASTGVVFYINGWAFAGTDAATTPATTITGAISNTASARIAATSDTRWEYKGTLDEVRIWDDVRTESEIRENIHLSLNGSCSADIIGYWKFNETTGTTALDLSGNGSDGTWAGTPTSEASECAVGLGVSTTHSAMAAGPFASPSVTAGHDLDLTFTTPPGGDIVVTNIFGQPVNGAPTGSLPENDFHYWVVNNYGAVSTGLGATAHFDYLDGEVGSVTVTDYKMHKRPSRDPGAWTENNPAALEASIAGGDNHVEFDAIDEFSQLFPSSNTASSPLQVTWIGFEAKPQGMVVQLDWVTGTEKDNEGFYVQRSLDGQEWETIGYVVGAGTRTTQTDYAFVDENPFIGENYYRLRQEDVSGAHDYSAVRIALISEDASSDITLYPNPNDGSFTVVLPGFESDQAFTFVVYDLLGSEVQRGSVQGAEGERAALNASELEAGAYLLQLRCGDKSWQSRFVVR